MVETVTRSASLKGESPAGFALGIVVGASCCIGIGERKVRIAAVNISSARVPPQKMATSECARAAADDLQPKMSNFNYVD